MVKSEKYYIIFDTQGRRRGAPLCNGNKAIEFSTEDTAKVFLHRAKQVCNLKGLKNASKVKKMIYYWDDGYCDGDKIWLDDNGNIISK